MSRRVALVLAILLLATPCVAAEKWATAIARNGDRGIVFRYIDTLEPGFDRSVQPDRVIIQWEYSERSGMPQLNERQRMDQLEDILTPALEKDGFATLALVSTGENLREWIYYCKDQRDFLARLNAALRAYPRFPIKVMTGRDPTWSSYQKFRDGVKR